MLLYENIYIQETQKKKKKDLGIREGPDEPLSEHGGRRALSLQAGLQIHIQNIDIRYRFYL